MSYKSPAVHVGVTHSENQTDSNAQSLFQAVLGVDESSNR